MPAISDVSEDQSLFSVTSEGPFDHRQLSDDGSIEWQGNRQPTAGGGLILYHDLCECCCLCHTCGFDVATGGGALLILNAAVLPAN